jgi:hypothetical protein
VDVDGPARRHVQDRARKELPEGDHHSDVGGVLREALGPAGIAQASRLDHRDAVLRRHGLHWRNLGPLAAAGGAIGLCHGRDHVVASEECVKRGQSERRSAVEQHAHKAQTVNF